MQNLAMQTALKEGKALDVRKEGVQVAEGIFRLKRYIDGKDYCDALKERWIWSVGRHVFDGRIEASNDSRYYQDPNWECLFLR
jgi:hypothetical protein